MAGKIEIDCELLLHWAYRDELSKRQISSAEGIWDRILEDGQRGGVDKGHGAAQRYCHFGLPDPDAELIEKAVGALEDTVIDWPKSFDTIAAELSALISVNEMAKQPAKTKETMAGWNENGRYRQAFATSKPRDALMVGGLRTAALVTMHAVNGTRPDWSEEAPLPYAVPAAKGSNAMIHGECKGRNLYSIGSCCPLKWLPSPMSIVSSRAEYIAWHAGLSQLAATIKLAKFIALPPKASQTPWLEDEEPMAGVIPVMPAPGNHVSAWGTLPLAPSRGKMGPPLRSRRAGPVRYPLEGEIA